MEACLEETSGSDVEGGTITSFQEAQWTHAIFIEYNNHH